MSNHVCAGNANVLIDISSEWVQKRVAGDLNRAYKKKLFVSCNGPKIKRVGS